MDKGLVKSLNDQLNFELYSAYIYQAMASHFKAQNLNGFANWMDVQVQEELVHATKFYTFLHDRNVDVELGAIAKPPTKWDSPLAVFEHALKHEQLVTKRINSLADQAAKVSDHATSNFLLWFINEQVEEEANTTDVIQQIKLVGKEIFMLDRELAQRVFTPPATPTA